MGGSGGQVLHSRGASCHLYFYTIPPISATKCPARESCGQGMLASSVRLFVVFRSFLRGGLSARFEVSPPVLAGLAKVTRSVSEGTGCHRERPSLTLRVTISVPRRKVSRNFRICAQRVSRRCLAIIQYGSTLKMVRFFRIPNPAEPEPLRTSPAPCRFAQDLIRNGPRYANSVDAS